MTTTMMIKRTQRKQQEEIGTLSILPMINQKDFRRRRRRLLLPPPPLPLPLLRLIVLIIFSFSGRSSSSSSSLVTQQQQQQHRQDDVRIVLLSGTGVTVATTVNAAEIAENNSGGGRSSSISSSCSSSIEVRDHGETHDQADDNDDDEEEENDGRIVDQGNDMEDDRHDDSTATDDGNNQDNDRKNNTSSSSSCSGLVLGPSRIPGAGWGVFAARTYQVGETIGFPGGHAIPVFDISLPPLYYNKKFHDNINSNINNNNNMNNDQQQHEEETDMNDNESSSSSSSASSFFGSLPEYLWEAANLGGFHEATTNHWYLPGPVSLVNHHPTLSNVVLGGLTKQRQRRSYDFDDENDNNNNDNDDSDRSGITYTYVHDRPLIATRMIEVGDELFLDYFELEKNAHHPAIQSRIREGYGGTKSNERRRRSDDDSSKVGGVGGGGGGEKGEQYSTSTAGIFPYTANHFKYADELVQSLTSDILEKDDGDFDKHKDNSKHQLTESQWMDILRRLRTELLVMADSSSLTMSDDDDERQLADEKLWKFKEEVSSLLPRYVGSLQYQDAWFLSCYYYFLIVLTMHSFPYRTRSELIVASKIGVAESKLLPKHKKLKMMARMEEEGNFEGMGNQQQYEDTSSIYHDKEEQLFCLDSVRPRTITASSTTSTDTEHVFSSSYSDRGGVVVTRSFQAGETVTVAPLVYIQNGTSAMEIVPRYGSNDSNTNRRSINGAATRQILANYCWKHRRHESMLCPTTYAAMIRHRSGDIERSSNDTATTMTMTIKKPNVKIQWLSSSWPSSSSSTSQPRTTTDILLSSQMAEGLDFVESKVGTYNTYHGGLAFEYVALRDILEGEELVVDSGSEYDEALVASFRERRKQNTAKSTKHRSADQLNRKKNPIIPSDHKIFQSHYHQYAYECDVYPNIEIRDGEEILGENWDTNRRIYRSNWPSDLVVRYGNNDFAGWYPCLVGNRTKGIQSGYDVEILNKGIGQSMAIRHFNGFPRDRIRWVEGKYQSPLHSDTAVFRFSPAIPDDIFPFHWRDDYRSASSWSIGHSLSSDDDVDYEQSLRSAKCGVYLAPSNIPGAGYGIYTAVDIPADKIGIGSSVIAVVRHRKDIKGFYWQGNDYSWSGDTVGLDYDGYPEYQTDLMQGLVGGMCNYHPGLVNVDLLAARSTPLLDRRVSPGAGSISDFANTSFRSTQFIEAGEELFISYGEHWMDSRESFQEVPLERNYEHVDIVAGSLYSLLNVENSSIPRRWISQLVTTLQSYGIENRRTKMALNFINNYDKLSHVIQRNGTARSTVTKRSQEWFEHNGFCQDNIYLNRSTIPHAGNGAFARRFIGKGTTVIASPLVASPRSLFEMNYTKQESHPINKLQLMINYHFGHKNSSLLLFPLTQASAINHNSLSSKFNGHIRAEPNARVEFSTDEPKSKYMLQLPLSDIFAEKYTSLFLNVVALRDIDPDEEVFIDYGHEWEHAWQDHVDNWKSPCGSTPVESCTKSGYFIQFEMGKDPHNTRYHTWSNDHLTVCQANDEIPWNKFDDLIFLTLDGGGTTGSTTTSDTEVHDFDQKEFTFDSEGFQYPFLSDETAIPCQILKSDPMANTFDVVYFLHSWQIPYSQRPHNLDFGSSSDTTSGEDALEMAGRKLANFSEAIKASSPTRALVFSKGLARQHMRFISKPLSADLHDPKAFRHEIRIADDMWPPLWKDLMG